MVKNFYILCLIICVVFIYVPNLFSDSSGGTYRYVDINSGVDNTSCDNMEAPCKYINYAIGQSSNMDIIHINGGNYNESIVVDKTLLLIGEGSVLIYTDNTTNVMTIFSDNVTVRNLKLSATGNVASIYINSSTDNLTIDNVTIGETDNVTVGKAIVADNVTNIDIINSKIFSSDNCIKIDNSSKIKIDNATVTSKGGSEAVKLVNVKDSQILSSYFINLDNSSICNGIVVDGDNLSTLDNITVDLCRFDNITGTGVIISNSADNITVKNSNFDNISSFMNISDNATDILIANNNFKDNSSSGYGFYIKNSEKVFIDNNTFTGTGSNDTLHIDNLSDSEITANNFNINNGADNISGLDNVTIKQNSVHNVVYIENRGVNSNNVTIQYNDFYDNGSVYAEGLSGFLTGIKINNNTFHDCAGNNAIYFYNVKRSNIYYNSVTNSSNLMHDGIYLENSFYNLIDNNSFLGQFSGYSIYIKNGDYNVLAENSMYSHSILLDNSSYNTLFRNITNLGNGFSSSANDNASITLDGSHYNIFFQNKISGTIYYKSNSDNNSIYFNELGYFLDNNSDEDYGQDNYWNSPVKIAFEYVYTSTAAYVKNYLGNYYDDSSDKSLFTDNDTNRDGIADISFTVDTIGNNDIDNTPMSSQSFDNYSVFAWWLAVDDSGNKKMFKQNLSFKYDNISIQNNDNISFVADDTNNMTFEEGDENDNTSWTGVLTFENSVNGQMGIAIGTYDNTTFTPKITGTVNCNGKICPFAIDNVTSFSTNTSEKLMLKITNYTGSSVNLIVGGGYTFISKPFDKYKAIAVVDPVGAGSVKINNDNKSYEYFFKNTGVKFEAIEDNGSYAFNNWSFANDNNTTYTSNPVYIYGSDNFTYVAHFSNSSGSGSSGGGSSSGGGGYVPPSDDGSSDEVNVDDTINLIDDIINQENQLKTDTVISAISDVANAIDNALTSGNVDVNSIVDLISNLDTLTNLAIQGGTTVEQLSNVVELLKQILSHLKEVAEQVENPEQARALTGAMGDVVNAGLNAAVKSGVSKKIIENIVSNVGDITSKALSKAIESTGNSNVTGTLSTVMEGAGSGINNIASQLSSGDTGQDVLATVASSLQNEVSGILYSVASHLSGVVASSIESVSSLSSNVSEMVGSVLEISNSGLGKEVVENAQNVANNALKLAEEQLLGSGGFGKFADHGSDNITDILRDNPEILKKVINITGINLTKGLLIDKNNITSILNQYNLTEQFKTELINGLPEIINSVKSVLTDNITKKTANTQKIVSSQMENIGLKTSDYLTGNGGELKIQFNNSIKVSVFVPKENIVSSNVPSGVHTLPDGSIISVKNGISTKLTPAPADTLSLTMTLIYKLSNSSFSAYDNSSVVKINNNGTALIERNDGKMLSVGFSYIFNQENSFGIGEVSFGFQGTNPASSTYSLLVKYSDGNIQKMPPMMAAFDLLVAEFDKKLGNNYTIDRNTGVIDVGGSFKYKPDYTLVPYNYLSDEDKSWFESNKDELGVAWKLNDYNNDGIIDVMMYSKYGKQIMFAFKSGR